MPFYRVAANTYCQQQMGYGGTGFAANTTGAIFQMGRGGFGGVHDPLLPNLRLIPPFSVPGYHYKAREGDKEAAALTFELDLDPGSYTITGAAADILADRLLSADPGTYTLTGFLAELSHGFVLSADPGSYSLTGAAATLLADRLLSADAGSYVITGAVADVLAARLLNADPGSYTITGAPTTLEFSGAGAATLLLRMLTGMGR